MDTILLILIILNLIFICFVVREEMWYFFKTYFLQTIGVISIIDTLWSFLEKIVGIYDSFIYFFSNIFQKSDGIPPFNSNSRETQVTSSCDDKKPIQKFISGKGR